MDGLEKKYPDLQTQTYNIHRASQKELFLKRADEFNVPIQSLGTPFLIIDQYHLVGFDNPQTTGVQIESWVKEVLEKRDGETSDALPLLMEDQNTITLPLLGEFDVFSVSLPALAVILGVIDGFNPCAMWVLVYLISLIAGLQDRTKIITLVSTFLAASGILYFLFMTTWLNVFLFMGYIPILTSIIGTAALYTGILNIKSFIQSGGKVVCEIGDLQSQQRTRSRIKDLIMSPLSWGNFIGIVALAFTVNSIEFVCSSALPAIFAHVLSVADLSSAAHYTYILLYVFFFMLDDLIIFSMAIMATKTFGGEKYSGFCKILGGGLMVLIGVTLLFFPQLLR